MKTDCTRYLQLDATRADAKRRRVPAVISSETPVRRDGFDEVLRHDANSIDLSRAPLPLIESHDGSRLNIGLVEGLRIDGRKLRGDVVLGTSARANELWPDIEAGVVRNLSIGYRIDDYEQRGASTIEATRWTPYEVSLVAVPADPAAGTYRSFAMNENESLPAGDAGEQLTRSQRRALNASSPADLAVVAERARVATITAEIDALRQFDGVRTLGAKAIAEGWPLERFRGDLLKHMGNAPTQRMAVDMRGRESGGGERKLNLARALQSEALEDLRRRRTRNISLPIEGSIATLRRALVSDAAGGITALPAMYQDVANAPKRPLALLDLLQRLDVSAGSFEFNQLTGAFAYAAAYQSTQASAKPEQSFPMALKTVPICTIAAWVGVSEQTLVDAPALQQRVTDLMSYGVMQALEAQVVAGAGGAAAITGLKTAGTAFTPAVGASNVDAIGEASAHLQGIGWIPNAVLLNPADWHAIRIAKSSGSGEYLAGSFDAPAQPNIWGLPVVPTPSLAAGTAIVLDASQALLLDRQSAAVQIAYDGNGFTQNVVTVRAELRAGLAVLAPTAVQVLTLT